MEENNNLEDFIKRRLESSEYQYQESDWLLLEKRMDAAGMVPVGFVLKNLKSVLLVLVLVTLAFLGGWLLRGVFVPEELSLSTTESISQNSIDPINNISALSSEQLLVEDCEEPVAGVVRTPELIAGVGRTSDLLAEGTSRKETRSSTVRRFNSIGSSSLAEKTNKSGDVRTDPSLLRPAQNEHSLQRLELVHGMQLSDITFPPVPILNKTQLQSSVNVTSEDEEERIPATRKLAFGISLSPDFNSVGFNRNGSITPKPGLQIYYDLNPKWTGSTGIFYNRKKYETNGEDYSPPPGYWVRRTKGVIPDEIYGSCSVIDIPLSIYYKWKDRDRVSFSAGLGLNSYFLLDEDYFWTFDSPNPGAEDGWRTDKNSTAYGGLITFSVALGVKLSQRSELVIEPYFKQPLKSVGWGNVEMYGTGTQFTFKFH